MVHRRRCPRCKLIKSLSDFKIRKNGYPAYCYPCEISYYREYNKKRYKSPEARKAELARAREKYNEVLKPARLKRKAMLIKLMGGQCVKCGYSKSAAALDFHHKNPKKKTRTVSHFLAINDQQSWRLAREEAAKCELLCSNCHREETYPNHDLDDDCEPVHCSKPARRHLNKNPTRYTS